MISTTEITAADALHYAAFGFCHLPGLVAADAAELSDAVDEVFAGGATRLGRHGRLAVPRIAERHETLKRILMDDDALPRVAASLVHNAARYVGGDGVLYTGDTYWHRDGSHRELTLVKLVLYLEPLTAQTGALRVIPGSQRKGTDWDEHVPALENPKQELGLEPGDVPCHVIESQPGDLIAFDPHIAHAALGGGEGRRQLTATFAAEPRTAVARQELCEYLLADRSVL